MSEIVIGSRILDIKDLKILDELDKNSRQSNSKIGKKVGLSKEVVKYRIDSLIKRGIIVKFQTIINYFKLGIIKFKLYLRFRNIDKNKLEKIAEYFYKHKKTEWVAITTGEWDLISGFLVRNINEFDDEVRAVLDKLSNYLQDKAVTTTLYLAHQSQNFIHKKKQRALSKIVYHTTKDPQEKVGAFDMTLLRILTNNARLPVTEIAKLLKTTPRVIAHRMNILERKNIIIGYRVHLDPRAMNKIFCKAIIYLQHITKEKLDNFVNQASSLPNAIWPQRVMGAWDFELDFELESYERFQEVLASLKEKFPKVIRDYEFCIVSKEFKFDIFPGAYQILKLK